DGCHGAARIGDDELWDVEVDRALDDLRYGAVRDGVHSEVVRVGARAGDAEEQRAGPGRAGVVGEVADLHGGASQDVRGGERCDDALEVHRRAGLPSAPAVTRGARGGEQACLRSFRHPFVAAMRRLWRPGRLWW